MFKRAFAHPTGLKVLSGLLVYVLALSPTAGADSGASRNDLTELSIEALMDIEVTSVSKKEQKVEDAPAAVTVITDDDIRRSGATTVMEALRLVPGLQVGRVDTARYAISARGFNGLFADKMLVLIDGRTIYTPLFSGVFWDSQDVFLEDIERIEVIRGPGAALWGANAVNGVINIISKSAKDTEGNLIVGGAGSAERGFGGIRSGAKVGENSFARVYGKYFNRDAVDPMSEDNGGDSADSGQGGFRLDSNVSETDKFRLQGDFYSGKNGLQHTTPLPVPPFSELTVNRIYQDGGNILGNWEHSYSSTSVANAQLYYDRFTRNDRVIDQSQDTVDFDFQHRFQLNSQNELMWGAGYRSVWDDLRALAQASFDPTSRQTNQFSGFVQDSYDVLPEVVQLTLGSKFEHNSYTGFEYQPSVRALYKVAPANTLWAAISRAVRTPSRANDSARLILADIPNFDDLTSPPTAPTIFGNPDFDSESLLAYEIGYRVEPTKNTAFDLSLFINDYDHLSTVEPGQPFIDSSRGAPELILPMVSNNRSEARSYGAEFVANFSPYTWWRLQAAYWYFELDREFDDNSQDPSQLMASNHNEPHNQTFLRSMIDFPENIEFDAMYRYVDSIDSPHVPSYSSLDVRLGWRPIENWEFSLVGQNLLDCQHLEYADNQVGIAEAEVERAFYGKAIYSFK